MRVMNDNILVSGANEGPRTTASGLYVPDTVQEGQVIKGTVVSVGQGRMLQDGTRVAPSIAAGETVWFPKFNANKVELSGVTHYVVAEQYILVAE